MNIRVMPSFMFQVVFLLVGFNFNIVYTSDESIVLSMQDMNNRSLEQAMVQSPFILQLELNNCEAVNDVKYISGMDNFKHSPAMRHSHISTYNGKTVQKIIYRFVLQAEKKGTYTLGHVSLKDKRGKYIKSNRLIVVVGDEIISSNHAEAPKYMVRSFLDKKSVHIGEKITLHLEFLDRIFVDHPSVVLPEFENLKILGVEQADATTIEQIHGYDYAVTGWFIDFYPTDHGSLIISDIKVRFLDERLEETSLAKGVFRRFGSMMKVQREVYINPVGLRVLALPKKEGFHDVTAVGQFSKLVISVNKNAIEQGQGLIFTVEIFGKGNFEMMESVPLVLPAGFQSYDADTTKIDKDRTCKHSEFIVQAQDPGNYHIAPQSFKYFDPADDIYKVLQSNSLDIAVAPNHERQKFKELYGKHDVENDLLQGAFTEKNLEDYSVLKADEIARRSSVMLPLRWYRMLFYFLLLMLVVLMVYRYGVEKYLLNHDRLRNIIIFFQAKKACKIAAYKNNTVVLYAIFIRLFIALKVGSSGTINQHLIEEYLKSKKFSREQIVQWSDFYSRLLLASFAEYGQINTHLLFQESLVWLQQLKEKI